MRKNSVTLLVLMCMLLFAGCESKETNIDKSSGTETKIEENVTESGTVSQEDSNGPDVETEGNVSVENGETTGIPGHEHSYTSEVTKEPCCEADGQGEITYTCSCGHSYTEKTDRIDHCTDEIAWKFLLYKGSWGEMPGRGDEML